MDKSKEFILWFDQLGIDDIPFVGGKNASLGEMYRNLSGKGVRVPNGFAITAFAYRYFLDKAGLAQKIRDELQTLDANDLHLLEQKGHVVRQLLLNATFPHELQTVILEAYRNLCGAYSKERHDVDVAVRSSATAEDLPDASFAGQQETYLNIKGDYQILDAVKRCFASLFTNRAISYRQNKGFDHFSIALSCGVQKMVRSDKACSGVMFTLDTESGFGDVVLITAAYGLGENVVQGAVNPDEYYVFKPTLKKGFKAIISKQIGTKEQKMVYTHGGPKPTKNVKVAFEDRKKFSLADDEVLQLATWGCIIEDHYSQNAGKWKPMDIEWAKDGESNELFIVQARPETVQSRKNRNVYENYELKQRGTVIAEGKSVGNKIGQGPAHIIKDVHEIEQFKKGEVLVTEMTDPDWEPIMKIASAIVTNKGGRTCHAAIVSRELGIPCVVGTITGTGHIKDKQDITVSCAEGDIGYVYDGKLPFEIKQTNLDHIPKTKTKIMMNVGNPEEAFNFSFIPCEGVGLAREEFIINSYIKIHPKALMHFDTLKDPHVKHIINILTHGYANKADYFVDKLAYGVALIGAAFYPKDVIVRMSDFKSNEYANLIGGREFEPVEDNPMIGWRGASRYYSDYKDAFALECKAMKKVRDELGLTNVKLMVPFCRTLDEARKVIAEMEHAGLKQGQNGLQIVCMCEIPSNVILADEFLSLYDGFSIGSNDLTQLTLGLDRDSALVADIYDERNPAVQKLIKQVIDVANRRGKYIGICGQGPSDHEDFAQFLVECGITSISLNPDTVIKTTLKIAEKEKALGIAP
ncbi:MAG: phosphoenolpyruvate synthase [archaeon]